MILAAHGILNSGNVYDVDALALITAIGSTTSTEKFAANYIFSALKQQGLYTKLQAFYPIIGGTAAAHKFNGKNPLNTNAAFRLTFTGGVTHASNGITFNGSTGYANTFFNSLTHFAGQNNMSIGGNFTASVTGIYYGATSSTGGYVIMQTGSGQISCLVNAASGSPVIVSVTTLNGLKFLSRGNGSNTLILNEGSVTNPSQNSIAHSNREIYIGCRNFNGTAANFLTGSCKSFYIGNYLTSSELLALNTIDNQFQTILGR